MYQLFTSVLLLVSTFFISVPALKIASALNTIEYTPEAIAKDYYKGNGTINITNGGVANIVTDTSIDLAGNAETQALVQYATHKDLRIIYTVCEVYYRIVANKKAGSGIATLKDLKGKKIGTFTGTSAAYFVQKYLATVGLGASDYTMVFGNVCTAAPCGAGTFPYMLAHGTIDAVGIWEPSGELSAEALGNNSIIFQDRSVYREIFNLHSTAEKLKDPATRKNIVAFVKALMQAEDVFNKNPSSIYSRVSSLVSVPVATLEAVWPVHSWGRNNTLPSDLMDVLVAEDQWVAKQNGRAAMSQSDLTNLIDPSVIKDALAG